MPNEAVIASNKRRARHGMYQSHVYSVWRGMCSRCRNHPRYAGRGIKVDPRWLVFEDFLQDMGEPPAGTTLDRVDNDGDYTKANCRWSTRQTQSNNTSRNRTLTHNGQTLTIAEWARVIGIKYATLRYRASQGWEGEKLFSLEALRGRT